MMIDIEYMSHIPPGFVGNWIRNRVTDVPVGNSMKFEPEDYEGVPMRHFHNTLTSVMGSRYGYDNMRILMDQQSGVIEVLRLR